MNFKTIFLIIAIIVAGYFCFNDVPPAKQVSDSKPIQQVELKRPQANQSVKESDISISSSEDTKPVVLFFYTEWCGACKHFKPTYKAIKHRVVGYRYVEVDADKNDQLSDYFNIRSIPTVYIYDKKNNYKAKVNINNFEKELRAYLDKRN